MYTNEILHPNEVKSYTISNFYISFGYTLCIIHLEDSHEQQLISQTKRGLTENIFSND